jgi:uncharacterized membrane protein HdeD (DUF308 family)
MHDEPTAASPSRRWPLYLGIALVVLGIAIAALPKEWIEESTGFEPDASNGMVELMLAVVPIAIGVALVVWALLARRHATSPEANNLPGT